MFDLSAKRGVGQGQCLWLWPTLGLGIKAAATALPPCPACPLTHHLCLCPLATAFPPAQLQLQPRARSTSLLWPLQQWPSPYSSNGHRDGHGDEAATTTTAPAWLGRCCGTQARAGLDPEPCQWVRGGEGTDSMGTKWQGRAAARGAATQWE